MVNVLELRIRKHNSYGTWMIIGQIVQHNVNLPELVFVWFQSYHLTIDHYRTRDCMFEIGSSQTILKPIDYCNTTIQRSRFKKGTSYICSDSPVNSMLTAPTLFVSSVPSFDSFSSASTRSLIFVISIKMKLTSAFISFQNYRIMQLSASLLKPIPQSL